MPVAAVLGASIFWVYPWAVDRGDRVLQWLVVASIAVTIPVLFINFGFQCWQPLAEMHQKEVLAAVAGNVVFARRFVSQFQRAGARAAERSAAAQCKHRYRSSWRTIGHGLQN